MDLRDYVQVLRRCWILISACTAAGLLIAGSAVLLAKPSYTATTRLFVAIQSSGTVQELQQGNIFTQARVQSYVKTVSTPVVLQPVIDSLGLDAAPENLAAKIKASNDVNTVIINIAATDSSPVRAAAIAQATGESLVRTVETLEKPRTGGESPVRLSVVAPATAPSVPSAPNTRLILILGLMLGLVAGVAASMLRALLDTKVRGEADLRRVTDAPVLGGVAFDSDANERPLLTQISAHSPRAESFRQLRTNLQFANVAGEAKSVLVTSSLPGEGKSTTATNLAIALAQGGQSVCLVDADLRRPMVNDYLGLDRNAGLTTTLIGAADVNDMLQPWGEDNLYVLTSGSIPPNPSELLGSAQMHGLLDMLEQTFDVVVIDAPPLLPVTDAAVLAQRVGGVIVVAGVQKVKRQDLERSLKALDMVGVQVLGIVMNRLPIKGPDAYSYTYYSNETTQGNGESKASRRSRDSAKFPAYSEFSLETLPAGSSTTRPPSNYPRTYSKSSTSDR
ncbi:polysaccharide biosynthesis tyrosine autokinase [Pseudarthrobacter sp. NPDC089323]